MKASRTVGIAAAVVKRRMFRIEAFACLKRFLKHGSGKSK
jgi:hypothetical protein